jgi:hypothetical protein
MKTKPSDEPLDVRKLAAELREYESSPARGGLKINMPLKDALRRIAKANPRRQTSKQKL